jgi:plastocyanin
VSVPRFLLAVPLLVAGVVVPTVSAGPSAAPAGTIGMGHEAFAVIGPGEDGRITSEPGAPSLGTRGAFLSESGQTYTTAAWNTPGTYHVTCSLHPEMTVTVMVTSS